MAVLAKSDKADLSDHDRHALGDVIKRFKKNLDQGSIR